jgi:hypothetical protein
MRLNLISFGHSQGGKQMAKPNDLSALVRPSSGLIAAVLLITALIGGKALADTPQTNRMNAAIAEVDAAIAKDAAFFVRIQAELLSYDRVLQMRMARGAIAGQETQRLLQQRAEDLVKGTVGGAAGVAEEREEAKLFFASIENAAAASPHWPNLQPPELYRAYVSVVLARARKAHEAALAAGRGAAQPLDDAYRALELTRGKDGDPTTTPFSDPYGRVYAALGVPEPPTTTPVTAPPSRLEVNIDRPGQNITVLELATHDVQGCESACEKNASCRAFSFEYSVAPGAKARCALKNGVPAPRRDPCCISEVK